MAYFVTCSFDLKNASTQDYRNAYADLENIGLKKVIVYAGDKKYVIPTTTVAGTFTGTSAATVRDIVREKVKNAFAARGFTSEIFVVVGGDWTWGAETT
jgi:hypothetical protein